MGGIINLIIFLVLTAYMFIYIYRFSARVKNPLNSTQYLLIEGTEMFIILLFATGTLALSSAGGGHGAGGGFNLQAIRLLILEVSLILSLFVVTEQPRWGIGTIGYLLYIIWLVYSLTYCSSIQFGVRYILKYIYPLLVMLAASAIVRDEPIFLSVCVWARRIALLSVVVRFVPIPIFSLFDPFWYITALNLNYVVVACISFALYYFYGKDKKDLILGILFFLPCLLVTHRSGLLAIFGGMAIFMFLKHKWISLPYIAIVGAIGLAIVFYVPAFHEKMFWKDTNNELTVADLYAGNIAEDDIRNNGREAVWTMLENEFYKGREMKGSGIGSCQKFLYENPNMVKQTHGDYVQMRCDTGLIGMWLYLAVGIATLLHCAMVSFRSWVPDHIKCCAMITGGSIVGMYLGMYSENVVTYTMTSTGYAFGFYGIMLGMLSKVETPHYQYKQRGL
ncbi:MAG: O-antigen ligase family protein [Bacteroidales bacterium]|nr:O-antigen ligase family protein [Bacteroidales bacterium]